MGFTQLGGADFRNRFVFSSSVWWFIQWAAVYTLAALAEIAYANAKEQQKGPKPSVQSPSSHSRSALLKGLLRQMEIFSDEHPPPHFRIMYAGVTARFEIADCSPLDGKALKKQHKAIQKWHKDNKAAIVDKWNETRPSNCPIGKITADGKKLIEPDKKAEEMTDKSNPKKK